MTTTGIRKVAMPLIELKELKDYAWRNRMSVSLVVREILEEFVNDRAPFQEAPDMTGSLSGSLTAYVPQPLWLAARDQAYISGRVPLTVIIRKGVRLRLEADKVADTA